MFFKEYKVVLLLMFLYLCVSWLVFYKEPIVLYLMLPWNVLLAVVPLFFIKKAELAGERGKSGFSILWMILWLAFFPNSVYMVTDFIHLSNDKFMWLVEVEKYSSSSGVVYSTDIMVWIKLLVIGFGFLIALLVGLESLYIFERIIKKKQRLVSWLAIIGVAILSGIGVYIGRFLRFNSWDLFANPLVLLKELSVAIDGFAVHFSVVFAIFILGSYGLFRGFRGADE